MKARKTAIIFLLLASLLVAGCSGQNTDFTLKVVPPKNLHPPLQGTWKVVSLLQEETASTRDLAQKWVGKNLCFADKYVLLGEYLLLEPHYQIKKVAADAYLFYRHQVFPKAFQFQDPEIEVLTLSDNHLFFCELLYEKDDKLLLNLFNNSYLARKISDEVEESLFPSLKTSYENIEVLDINNMTEITSNRTGVLLGLCAPDQDPQGNSCPNYRTLLLTLSDQKLSPVLETKTIVFPRKSGFYQLQVVKKETEEKIEDLLFAAHLLKQEEEEEVEESNPLEQPPEALYPAREQDSGAKAYIARRIRFIGNDYISVEETIKQTPANEQSAAESKLHLFAVDSLPNVKAVKISDLAGPDAIIAMEHGRQKLWKQLGLEHNVPPDEKNFGLGRKMGYWIFNGRINYQKNGAFEKADYNITVIPPDNVVCYNKLQIPWTRLKNYVPSALDVFTSPAKDLALVVTDSEIIVYGMCQGDLTGPPLERIPLNKGEEVIMAEWALGRYVEDWSLAFKTYLKTNRDAQ